MKAVLAVVVIAGLVVSACGSDSGKPASTGSPLVDALCKVRDELRHGDTSAARRDYYDHAHDALHDLARRAAERDRAGTARLLEAHQRVEDDLEHRDTPAAAAGHDADELITRTRTAIRAVDNEEPTPCTS
jgi:hypothetical protein